jgi:flagellar protein FlaJ
MVEIPSPGRIKQLILSGKFAKLIIYIASGISIGVFLILALLRAFDIILFSTTIDLVVFAILSGAGIFGMYEYQHYHRIRKIDMIFPDFVRDIAASRRAGMTFTNAILFTSKGNYGLLTPEIKKMAQQISWGSSVEDALTAFAERVRTKSIQRTISLIIEASKSGGHVVDVLEVAARDAREIKNLEADRRVNMASYVIVIYVAMFVFLAITAILAGVFIPSITSADTSGLGGFGSLGGITQAEIIQVFYLVTLVQGMGSGLVAGIFEDGHLESSVKHVFIMVLVAWLVFSMVIGL